MNSAFNPSADEVAAYRSLANLQPPPISVDPVTGSVSVDLASVDGVLSGVVPDGQRLAFGQLLGGLSNGGAALIPDAISPTPVALPWEFLSASAASSTAAASGVVHALGLGQSQTAATVTSRVQCLYPHVPESFFSSDTAIQLHTALPRPTVIGSAPIIAPASRLHPMDLPGIGDIEKIADALASAHFGPWEGHKLFWPIGFEITLSHDKAAELAQGLTQSGAQAGAALGKGIMQALTTLASQGLRAAITGALTALAAGPAVVLEAIAWALGENINLVNGPEGVSLECNWPYPGFGLFFWAQPASGAKTPVKVALMSPAVGEILAGQVTVLAARGSAQSVHFSVSYATNPADNSTVQWHPIPGAHDVGNSVSAVVWDTTTIPDQFDTGRGLVNIGAFGVDGSGNNYNPPAQDYRVAGVRNHPAASTNGTWNVRPGAARDIGVGADGSVWVIGTGATGGGYSIYRWNGTGWDQVDGGAVRIAVDPGGLPWVVNDAGNIYQRTANGWVQQPGLAKDIGIGADGSVWVIGVGAVTGGNEIYQWNGSSWVHVDGGAVRIAVDPGGMPWVVNDAGNIFQRTSGGWQELSGLATDIGIGADGVAWVVGANPDSGGYMVYQWTGGLWQLVDGGATQISVKPNGFPWMINSAGTIFERQ